EKNDPAFAKELASLAELYVSDAFGTVHRAHASTVGVAAYLPAVAGFLIGKELAVMGEALDNPVRPFTAILGGAKVADKIAVIENLLQKCDSLIIGGGMAFTFLAAEGYGVGNSLLDKDSLGLAKDIMTKAKSRGVKFLLPVDVEIAKAFEAEAEHKTVQANKIPEGWMGMDIGPESAKLFAQEVINAKTVIWNGPMGVFEFPAFAKGTAAVAEACANCRGTTIIGGGDSASAVKKLGYASQMTHISTGGGASLEFLEGKVLPGVAALNDK
ncbi:MAG: phosphoglycerate kinase, partial [Clostridia bacterium]|nr:phosphoglycerate kinase [Clostridia bacterium]